MTSRAVFSVCTVLIATVWSAGFASADPECVQLHVIDIGNPASEAGHNLVGWGPIEPASSGGNYGGIADCRVVYASAINGDGNDWATVDIDFGSNPVLAKCLTIDHLDGITKDAFRLFVYPAGQAGLAQQVLVYPGDNSSAETWLTSKVTVYGTGVHTLHFVSTEAPWSGWATYGQIAIDNISVAECTPVKDMVDIGDPVSEAGHNLVAWGPIEPANSGGNYGGIDDCRAVYASAANGDGNDWATIDLDFGECVGLKCVTLQHLDGITKDAFEVYLYPVGDPGSAQLVFSYAGDNLTSEIWLTSSFLVTASGLRTMKLVSTQPPWSSFATYGQMCFDEISVEDFVPTSDYVDIGDPVSEGGHNLVGWGPIEPASSGGNYGGIDDCRVVYASATNGDGNNWATIDLDFGNCVRDPKCLSLRHLDGIALDAFDVFIYPPGHPELAALIFSYPGSGQTGETWGTSDIAVGASGVQTVKFVSTQPPWSGWATYGQVAFDEISVKECQAMPTPVLLSLFRVETASEGLELRWQFGDAFMFVEVHVERSDQATGPWMRLDVEHHQEEGMTVALDRDVTPDRTYFYRLVASRQDGQELVFGPRSGTITGTSVAAFELGAVVPNPSMGPARIEFAVPRQTEVRLVVLDIQGREIAVLARGLHQPGRYQATWAGRARRGNAPAGIYFIQLQTPEQKLMRRIVLAR